MNWTGADAFIGAAASARATAQHVLACPCLRWPVATHVPELLDEVIRLEWFLSFFSQHLRW